MLYPHCLLCLVWIILLILGENSGQRQQKFLSTNMVWVMVMVNAMTMPIVSSSHVLMIMIMIMAAKLSVPNTGLSFRHGTTANRSGWWCLSLNIAIASFFGPCQGFERTKVEILCFMFFLLSFPPVLDKKYWCSRLLLFPSFISFHPPLTSTLLCNISLGN